VVLSSPLERLIPTPITPSVKSLDSLKCLLGRPTLVGKALSFTHELSFSFLSIHRALSSRAVDSHQMYFGGSVVSNASTIGIDLAHPSPNFRRGQKVKKLASFKTSLNFEPHAFENAAIYPSSETKVQCCDDHPMSLLSLMKLVHESLRKLCQLCPTPKIARENV